jgi:hypothetical protein
MNLQDKLNEAIKKGWTCNIQTGEVWSHTGKLINKIDKTTGYIKCSIRINKKILTFKAHQFIYYVATGIIPTEIDHEDGDKSNNKITNLINGTKSENQQNVKSTKGYSWHKQLKKWLARIKINNESIYLGVFDTEEEARQAYLDAKKIFHPTKAHLFT